MGDSLVSVPIFYLLPSATDICSYITTNPIFKL